MRDLRAQNEAALAEQEASERAAAQSSNGSGSSEVPTAPTESVAAR